MRDILLCESLSEVFYGSRFFDVYFSKCAIFMSHFSCYLLNIVLSMFVNILLWSRTRLRTSSSTLRPTPRTLWSASRATWSTR